MCCYKDLSDYRDVAHLALRLGVATVFLYAGVMKWQFWGADVAGMTPMMLNIMRFLSIAEPLAALGLILGLLSQLSAFGLMLVMIAALWQKVSAGMPFSQWQFDMILLVASFVIVIEGPGAVSLDMKCSAKHHHRKHSGKKR